MEYRGDPKNSKNFSVPVMWFRSINGLTPDIFLILGYITKPVLSIRPFIVFKILFSFHSTCNI
jgi:hypothetical protein